MGDAPTAPDPYDLDRFVRAQAEVHAVALAELKSGRKLSHWMWFVFPQLKGLGFSETARHYGIASLDEAVAYLDHPVLGPRLLEATAAATEVSRGSARDVFGAPDDLKFRSSMTLFARAATDPGPFRRALLRYFDDVEDGRTLDLLSR